MNSENQFILRKAIIRTAFTAIIFLGMCISVFAAEYNLDELYNIALERFERIKISEEDVFIAEKNRDKAMSLLLPKLSAEGTYTGYKDRKYSTSGSQIQPDKTASWSARLDQTMSTSGTDV